ncbi:hypothetical protein MHM84_03475 [Halomonas sp. McH1-25]|uniref:hypothetical protein n=1 Tax=unclassified Halomonas TaxID=2609666 RepID=UPI001EF73841|nr:MULTISPECIES: hypothetical protein [unclassified Halomonas]MCG7598832.1 hypothetical protein [Halomonas sp. McH1-25]MCP1340795.1 hypothetical protein [Halomonas sp. FL8]MCP1362218.1 hypothetical protein [Halomonas sp. BBD45]MCP1364118.1 hypothetical protein [Halomonas sp. BBD48]
MNAYIAHDGEPVDGACLVFASTAKEAKRLAAPVVQDWSNCEYIDVRVGRFRNPAWLLENVADKEKLAKGEPHVIESPPTCNACNLWHDELFDGYCESCADERTGGNDG